MRMVGRYKKENIVRSEALRRVVEKAIEYCSPVIRNSKRTVSRLRYEILRMVAYEGAVESQMMWDLGFGAHKRSTVEKLHRSDQPRFPLSSLSEYSATIIRSFKRFKNGAFEML